MTIKLNLTRSQRKEQREYLAVRIMDFPSELPTLKISEHAEEKRILPPGTPRPGPLDLSYTPYLIEPMDNMCPQNTVQKTDIMKGAQLGFTMMAECVLCYYIGYDPSDQMFMSSSESGIEKWASKRLEPAISSYGYRHLIKSSEEGSGKRKGDKQFSKEYRGMRLDMVSAQSASGMRSDSKKILIRDEIDGAPAKLRTGEGNFLDVSYARTNAWGDRRKVLDFSTPTKFEISLIWREYKKGDQRKYQMRCVHCNEPQELEFKQLVPEKEDGLTVDVFYACKHCGAAMYNYHKDQMFSNEPFWEPTATSITKNRRSYHINSLYSPVGMMSWLELYTIYEAAEKSIDPDDMVSFTNLYLGMPHKQVGQRPKLNAVLDLRGTWEEGIVPDMVLFLTIGIDVQRGSKKDELNPARLELEVLGHGPGYRTFSIMYKKIEGAVDDPFSGAWEQLNQWALDTELTFKKQNGSKISVALNFIDSGDGETTDVVYRFCGRWKNTYPIKGKRQVGQSDNVDKATRNDYKRFSASKVGEDTLLYVISTNLYKAIVYNSLKIKRIDGDIQSPGFSDFPIERNDNYFKMLTAEEKRTDGNFYNSAGRRNEALDCRVYALCAGDVYIGNLIDIFRKKYKTIGAPEEQIKQINAKWVIEYLKKQQGVVD